jgi:hypothetical protein
MSVKDRPVSRRLRVFAFDPSLSASLETSRIHRLVIEVPWEELAAGPVGEYVEVVDWDPASGCCYSPIELDGTHLLAQDGWSPPSRTRVPPADGLRRRDDHHRHFERALGRPVLWRPRPPATARASTTTSSSAACASTRTPCATATPTTARGSGAAVRLLPGDRRDPRNADAGEPRLHLPVARHRRPRDHARASSTASTALQRADEPRRARLPRGLRRHRRAVPALHLPGGARGPDLAHPRQHREPSRCWVSSPVSSGARRPALRRSATPSGRPIPRPASGRSGSPIPTPSKA